MYKDYIISEYEKKGREAVVNLFTKYQFTESPNVSDSWDLSGQTNTGDFFMEIKYRKIASTDFTTSLLEVKKRDGMKVVATPTNATMFYTCLYQDNVAVVWNLKEDLIKQCEFTTKQAQAITADINSYVIDKPFIELPISAGNKYFIKK